MNCYIFVPVGVFKCLKTPGNYVVMDSKDYLVLEKEYFTKQPTKEVVNEVAPLN